MQNLKRFRRRVWCICEISLIKPYLTLGTSFLLDQKPKPIQPPDDEIGDAANEYLAEQYDNEIQEFYREAQEQARLKN